MERELTDGQQAAQQHPLYPHLKGLVRRAWRAMLADTAIDGQSFADVKCSMSPDTSGSLVGALFEIYFNRQLVRLTSAGMGVAFFMPLCAGGVGNQPDVRHVLDASLSIEIKTTRDRYISQRPSSIRSMKRGYWLLSVKYDWKAGDGAVARFGWVDKTDWGSMNKGNRVRLPDDVYWDRHLAV